MKTLASFAALALSIFAGTTLPAATSAQAEPIYQWCMQPSGRWGPDCAYTTLQQCRATAAAVGFCYENPAYTVATQGRPERPRR